MSDDVTIISKNVFIKGDICGNATIDCSGTIEGDVAVNSLIVKQDGNIKGKVFTKILTLSVGGSIIGDVVANSVKVCKNAEIVGNLKYNTLSVEDGAKLNITCECLENDSIDRIIKEYTDANKIEKCDDKSNIEELDYKLNK